MEAREEAGIEEAVIKEAVIKEAVIKEAVIKEAVIKEAAIKRTPPSSSSLPCFCLLTSPSLLETMFYRNFSPSSYQNVG